MKRTICFLFIFILIFSGCKNNSPKYKDNINSNEDKKYEKYTRELFAMDTYITLEAYGENAQKAVEQAVEKINDIENELSVGVEGSEVAIINKEQKGSLSEDGKYLLEFSLDLSEKTENAFSPTIYPMMRLWGFTDKKYHVPSQNEIDETLDKTNINDISFDKDKGYVTMKKSGMGIDLGGIAKGYASSQIMEIYKQNNIKSGIVNLGGNVQVMGKKPDGTLWKIAVQDPENEDDHIGVLEIEDKAVITSGGYERYFENKGEIYHHIIDPKTGYPAKNDLKSVTVISDDGTLADGLSTSLFVMGLDKAEAFRKEDPELDFEAVYVTNENKIYITEGLKDCFLSEHRYEVLE